MDAAAELGRNPVSEHQIQPSLEMSRLTRDGTAEPISRDQIIRRELEQYVLCVFFPFILDIKWTYQPGSHRRKVTQDFSSTFFLRCVP